MHVDHADSCIDYGAPKGEDTSMNVIRGVARAGRIALGGTVAVVGGAYVFDWAETEYWLQHVRPIVCVLYCHAVYMRHHCTYFVSDSARTNTHADMCSCNHAPEPTLDTRIRMH